jgi:hypothetical protein
MIVLAPPASAASELQLDPENPWPGLAAYDEESHRFFSGRAAESGEALRRIVDEPVTVLFGKSGLGKTSLLNAGVFPRLRKHDMLPVVVRLHVRDASGPLIEQAYRRLIEEFRLHGVEHPDRAAAETLWEYLHRAAHDFWTPQNRLVRPVFVFDQFEELFTLGRAVPAQVEAFREDLADLAENRIPAAAVRHDDDALDSDVCLNTRRMPYHIVIALREDFLADLEGWRATMPSLRRNRMRLLPMRSNQALEAVCNERTNHLVSEALARKIVAYLSSCGSPEVENEETARDGTVEPALLSLFCRGINEQRKREGKSSFDPPLLEGAKDTLVRDFYVDCLADQPARVRRFIEDELVTESGYRNSYSVKDAINGGVITESQLDALINRHLLRHEHHLGTDRVELTHDLLTRAVVEERDRRVLADRARRDRRQRLKFGSLAAASALIAVVFAGFWLKASAARREADLSLAKADTARAVAREAQRAAERHKKTAEDQVELLKKAQSDLQLVLADANEQRDRATTEKNRSRSRELAAHAEAAMHADPELAIALGLRAMAYADTVEARSALIDVARYAWPYADLHQADLGGIPRALAISGSGERLVVLAGRNAISVWDVTRRKPMRLWPDVFPASSKPTGDDAASVAFSPDEKVIAVGRRRGIDLVDAQTGRVNTTLPQFTDAVEDRRIVFSPDGQWLASSQADESTLLLAKLGDPPGLSEVIKTGDHIGGFAVLRGGQAIVTVGGRPLAAHELSRRDGTWHEDTFDLMSCVQRHSVSPGSEYVSATWTTTACMIPVDGTRPPIARDSLDGTTHDIVWSNGGAAFTELVDGRQGMLDLVVGRRTRSGPLKSHIKGAHPMDEALEKSRLVSVSETATRVALIDADDHELVRIYSVGGFKPFMSEIESAFAVAPDGSWMAIARPGVGSAEQTATINVVPLEHAFTPDQLALARVRIAVNRIPTQLYASSSSIVAVQNEEKSETTSVFDAFTGASRFEPLSGRWRPLGSAAEMLLFTGNPQRIVRTVDGAPIEQWSATPGADELVSIRVSPSEGALAVFRQAPRTTGPINATLYSVRRDSLRLTGRVTNLPRSWNRMVIAEDAHSLSDGGKVWHITKGVTTADGVALASPLGRFEVQRDSDDSTYRIVRRHDRSVIVTAQLYRFSDDDRWLAAARDGILTVYDLSRGEAIFKLTQSVDPAPRVESMAFAGQGILHVRFTNASMLVPLDWPLMERFLQWLTTRTLTPREECRYRLRTTECWNELPLRAQKAGH